MIGPASANLDLAFAKTWSVSRTDLEFRWEIFNPLNRTNFDLPNRIFGTANFGRIFSAKAPREMQFGLRLELLDLVVTDLGGLADAKRKNLQSP